LRKNIVKLREGIKDRVKKERRGKQKKAEKLFFIYIHSRQSVAKNGGLKNVDTLSPQEKRLCCLLKLKKTFKKGENFDQIIFCFLGCMVIQ